MESKSEESDEKEEKEEEEDEKEEDKKEEQKKETKVLEKPHFQEDNSPKKNQNDFNYYQPDDFPYKKS